MGGYLTRGGEGEEVHKYHTEEGVAAQISHGGGRCKNITPKGGSNMIQIHNS